MRSKIAISLMAMFIGCIAFAQPGPGPERVGTPEERAEKMTKHMAEKLQLSAEQEQALLALNTEEAKKMAKARAESRAERKAKMDELKAERQAYNAKVKEILTEEQYTKFKEAQKARKEKLKEKRFQDHQRREELHHKE